MIYLYLPKRNDENLNPLVKVDIEVQKLDGDDYLNTQRLFNIITPTIRRQANLVESRINESHMTRLAICGKYEGLLVYRLF